MTTPTTPIPMVAPAPVPRAECLLLAAARTLGVAPTDVLAYRMVGDGEMQIEMAGGRSVTLRPERVPRTTRDCPICDLAAALRVTHDDIAEFRKVDARTFVRLIAVPDLAAAKKMAGMAVLHVEMPNGMTVTVSPAA